MTSLTADHFATPEFRGLSEHGQAYLRALLAARESFVREGPDAPKTHEAFALADAAWDRMTEAEANEVSAYAHRCDYPDQYPEAPKR